MSNTPRLSVILTFKNQREEAENTLQALLELEQVELELVILDDGSTDGTREVIHSLLEHYPQEHTYFFEHEGTHGRGNLLNEGLNAIDGSYLWMPKSIEQIDEEHLMRVLKALDQSDKTGLLQRPHMIPETIDEWVDHLDNESLPQDAVYLWNLGQIPPRERFVSPYLINHHATELAARVLSRSNAGLIDPFYTVSTPGEPIQPDINVVSEFVFTLLRRPGLESGQKDFLLSLLNPSVDSELPDRPQAEDEELFEKALRYYRAGNISASLEFVNTLLEQNPDHKKALKLKIEILEKLRRYVEAAELKHQLRGGEERSEKVAPDSVDKEEQKTTPSDSDEPHKASSNAVDREAQEFAASDSEESAPESSAQKESGEEMERKSADSKAPGETTSGEERSETPSQKDIEEDEQSVEIEAAGEAEADEKEEAPEEDGERVTSGEGEDDFAETDASEEEVKTSSAQAGEGSSDETEQAEPKTEEETLGQESEFPKQKQEEAVEATGDTDSAVEEQAAEAAPDPSTSETSEPAQQSLDIPDTPHPEPDEVEVSLIVPTTADGKPALEQLMVSLENHADPRKHELIVVDNASLDDTHDYLSQLQEDNFFNCRVVTHSQNQGFARSVNAGLDKAEGRYACILHNDISLTDNALEQLTDIMDEREELALVGPSAENTINPQQRPENLSGEDELVAVDYLDSFCMMLRMSSDLRMDQQYGLAYFEDVDLCFQAQDAGFEVAVFAPVALEHYQGVTTAGMGLDLDSRQYWYNASLFNEKWDIDPSLPEDIEERDEIEQLLTLNERVNPFYPEEKFKAYFQELLDDELRTRLLEEELDKPTLLELVDLMMTMDQRDILRRLEDRIEEFELPSTLIYRLLRYYYKRNIYSRCKHYLQQLPETNRSPRARLYELQIAVGEKQMEDAIPLLSDLMDELPGHPELYRQAARIHQFEGNKDEAESFAALAAQLDPFNYADVKV